VWINQALGEGMWYEFRHLMVELILERSAFVSSSRIFLLNNADNLKQIMTVRRYELQGALSMMHRHRRAYRYP